MAAAPGLGTPCHICTGTGLPQPQLRCRKVCTNPKPPPIRFHLEIPVVAFGFPRVRSMSVAGRPSDVNRVSFGSGLNNMKLPFVLLVGLLGSSAWAFHSLNQQGEQAFGDLAFDRGQLAEGG